MQPPCGVIDYHASILCHSEDAGKVEGVKGSQCRIKGNNRWIKVGLNESVKEILGRENGRCGRVWRRREAFKYLADRLPLTH